jgi:hypothetical protein
VALRTDNHINAFVGYDKRESHQILFTGVEKALSLINDQSIGTTMPITQINAASAAHSGRAGRVPKPPDAQPQDESLVEKQKGLPKTVREFFALYLNRSMTAIDTKVLSKFLWLRMQKKRKQQANKTIFEASHLEKARLLAIRAPGASTWLNASLEHDSNQLSN